MILYFSATGNSEYVAKAIAERLSDETVCLNSYIKNYTKEGKTGSFSSEKPYVFVFPVYLSTSPTVLREFIKDSSFSGNGNVYFVPTCASADGSVPNSSIDLCNELSFFTYMGTQKVPMPQNYVILFSAFDEEKKKKCYENVTALTDSICQKIKAGEKLEETPCSGFEYWGTKLVEKWYNHSFTKTKWFRATDACINCGLCAKNCPTNSIEMQDNKPAWIKKTCIHCMACISRCPKHAIEFGNLSKGKTFHVCPSYTGSEKKE